MKIGVLTSSRADYGIYLPLLQKLKIDSFFELEIIAFGTHLSKNHGYTLKDIVKDGYNTIHEIISLVDDDSQKGISTSYGNTVLKFSEFWENYSFDLVLCLGDRFEMSAAVQASIPFGLKLAHIHGGETTLGAIDNIYRHQITLASSLHFTSTDVFRNKVASLIDSQDNIYSVGSLSLDDLRSFVPIDKTILCEKFAFPNKEFALITFHPETIDSDKNIFYAQEMRKALAKIATKLFLIITMPNADTMGSILRNEIENLKDELPNQVSCIENFGKENYFSAMFYAKILIGNTSSGIIEAASFNKYVINVGDRQKGRAQSENILHASFNKEDIIEKTFSALNSGMYSGKNIYYKQNAADNIIEILK